MVIRSATTDDIDRCSELLAALFEQEAEFTPDSQCQKKGLQMIIENPSHGAVLVCEDKNNGFIVGMAILLYTVSTALGKKVALLEDMIVDPAYRSQGIGSLLLQHAVGLAEDMEFGRITLLTDEENKTAHAFYRNNGFVQSGMVVFRKIISSS